MASVVDVLWIALAVVIGGIVMLALVMPSRVAERRDHRLLGARSMLRRSGLSTTPVAARVVPAPRGRLGSLERR